jgi:hypothetical protein
LNINYLVDNNSKNQLDALLSSFNISSIVEFPTRIQVNSSSAIDNIFIDLNRHGDYTIRPHVNGLSDHDAQIPYLNNIASYNCITSRNFTKRFSNVSRNEFLTQLSYETWDSVFVDQDIDSIFNLFLSTYLRIFNSSFHKKLVKNNTKLNPWMMNGIKTSCQHKRELYLSMKIINDPNLKYDFKTYSKILSKVIRAAKKLHYDKLISNSKNKIKATWNIIKTITGKRTNNTEIQFLNINGKITDNHHLIADSLNLTTF